MAVENGGRDVTDGAAPPPPIFHRFHPSTFAGG